MLEVPTLKRWSDQETEAWRVRQKSIRSYTVDVVVPLHKLPNAINVETYGTLDYPVKGSYPLLRARIGHPGNGKPNILITGGVHGYEKSGVMAPLRFLQRDALSLSQRFNFLVYPCLSPWSYEVNHRWNPQGFDTNRHFREGVEPAAEAVAFMNSVQAMDAHFSAAIDLHETNDHDIILEREKAARNAVEGFQDEPIPQGFYLVMNPGDKTLGFGDRIIESVRHATAICKDDTILGQTNKNGVIYLEVPGLCMEFMRRHAAVAATTEVYPDPIPEEESLEGQLAAIRGLLEFVQS